MTTQAGKTVLLLGATGATGSSTLLSLLASPSVAAVHSLGRRAPTLPATVPEAQLAKLTNTTVDFEALLTSPPSASETAKFSDVKADSVVIALGTTRAAAGGMDGFVKIDREYVLAGAKAAKVEEKPQVVVYCSSGAASSSSWFPYLKSKGVTEEGLASLGYAATVLFRPGMLVVPGGRDGHFRLAESIAKSVTGVLTMLGARVQIETTVLGAAMARAATVAPQELGVGKPEVLPNGAKVFVVGHGEALTLGSRK